MMTNNELLKKSLILIPCKNYPRKRELKYEKAAAAIERLLAT